jgi:predicted nucleic acid-binding protein
VSSGFLLDTNVPSEMLRSRPEANVIAWVKRQVNETLFVSVVTLGELRRGVTLLAEQSSRRAELERMIHEKVPSWFQDRTLPITRMIAERWGVLDGERQLAGRPLNIADGMIAATALEHDLSIVTRNVKDFEQLGITIINPWEST